MNWTINPCDDFYTFSCGGWMTSTEIPPEDNVLTRSFSVIQKNNEAVLKAIVNDPTVDPKLQAFYSSCMNLTAIENNGLEAVYSLFDLIQQIDGDYDNLMAVVSMLHMSGTGALFTPQVVIDSKNPTSNIFDIGQGGLALPDASYYFDNEEMIAQYIQHIANMFELATGVSVDQALALAAQVLEFETAIASITVSPDNLIDPFVVYNKFTFDQLQQLTPNLKWNSYLKGMGLNFRLNNVLVDAPAFLGNLSIVVAQYNNDWEPYLLWQLIHSIAPYGPKALVLENFNFFGKILSGKQQLPTRDTTCVRAVDASLGELLGKYYVQRAFPGASKTVASQMIQSIEDAMHQDLNSLSWMDDQTRSQALTKLSLIANMIGYPDNPRNYTDVPIQADDFLVNVLYSNANSFMRNLHKLKEPADRYEWEMTPPTVNAYYDPTKNEMVFPAGILQSPFFNLSYPLAMNYGGAGMVMGHELTHGFDNQGKDYDGTGTLRDWWQPQTEEEFDRRAQCVINQYSQFQPLPGVFVNGKLTQGENIADMGGIKNSFSAYTKLAGNQANAPSIVQGLTNGQLFFVAFAQGWCQKATDNYIKIHVKTDPHSPARFRVIGPLVNLPEFSQTFNCPAGSFMNPTNRCTVW
jgi:putative endopeptidase